MIVPLVQTLQEIRSHQLIVVGQRQPAGGRRVKYRNHNPVLFLQLAAVSAQRFFQILPVVARFDPHHRLLSERPGGRTDLLSLRIPAEKGPAAEYDLRPLLRHQPPQRAVGFLRRTVADGRRLPVLRKTSSVGISAGIIGGDQLGVSIDRDNPFRVLFCQSSLFPRNHTEAFLSLLLLFFIPAGEGVKQRRIFPAGVFRPFLQPCNTPAHQQFFVRRQTLFVTGDQPVPRQIRKDRPVFYIGKNRRQQRVTVLRRRPFLQLLHIHPVLHRILTGQIPQLVAQRMSAWRTRPACRGFRDRDDNFFFLLVHRPGIHKLPCRIYRDFQLRPGEQMRYRNQRLVPFPELSRQSSMAVKGFHCFLKKSHQFTSPNSLSP